jgi:hypothetical protein
MKKVLSIVLVLVVTTAGFAQKHSKDLRIGFKIEPNISWFNPVENGVKGDGSKVGINYGLMVDYEFADNYIFSTGLQVSHVGGKLSYVGNNTGFAAATTPSAANVANYNIGIQYVEVPFTLKLKSSNKGKMDYWASFGGFLAVPVKARADYQTNFSAGSMDNVNVISGVQPINIGMQIGGGVEIPISDKNVLVAGLVFNNGFIDVTKNGNWGGDGRVNLNSVALKLGIFF